LARRRENTGRGREKTLEKKNAILAALSKVTGGFENTEISDNPDCSDVYYSLSPEEIKALISGDTVKIESWVNNLDRRQATWLLRQLIKEKW
jgi:hypothetical protein